MMSCVSVLVVALVVQAQDGHDYGSPQAFRAYQEAVREGMEAERQAKRDREEAAERDPRVRAGLVAELKKQRAAKSRELRLSIRGRRSTKKAMVDPQPRKLWDGTEYYLFPPGPLQAETIERYRTQIVTIDRELRRWGEDVGLYPAAYIAASGE